MFQGTVTIYHEDKPVGQGTMEPAGLYTRFRCDCGPNEGTVLRLVLHCSESDFLLGVPVPEGDRLGLCRKIATKNLPGDEPERMCLYAIWPIPKVEEKEEITENVESNMEEKAENEEDLELQVENSTPPPSEEEGTLYVPDAPLEGIENWERMRTREDADGNLRIIVTDGAGES